MFGRLSHRAPFVLVCTTALAAALLLPSARGEACSCVGPELSVLTPQRPEGVPTNTRVRVTMPAVGQGQTQPTLALRVHGGADVVAKTRLYPDVAESIAELTPMSPLAPSTRYEIAVVDSTKHPATTVVSTFVTGANADTAAPVIDSLGAVGARLNMHYGGGDCSIQGPWVTVDGSRVHDPGRPDAELLFGVWGKNAQGVLDTNRAPDALLAPYHQRLNIGRSSLCDMRDFPLKGPIVQLAIAVFDEAGNASTPRRFSVDVTRNSP
jgi:hypothetical protein